MVRTVGIVGLGAIGSMAAWRLALRGVRVTAFDQYAPSSNHGASAGETRLFRVAYKEGVEYTPLMLAAISFWQELEQRSGRTLLHHGGSLMIGAPEHQDVAQVIENARESGVVTETLDQQTLASRFPQFRLMPGDIGVLDPLGGLLRPELATLSATEQAATHGAEIRTGVRVESIEEVSDGVVVTSSQGAQSFDRVVVAPGPWSSELLDGLTPAVRPERIVSIWFPVDGTVDFTPAGFVPTLRRGNDLDMTVFPSVDGTFVKVNSHLPRTVLDHAEGWDRMVEDAYVEATRDEVRRGFNGLRDLAVRRESYMDGYTLDGHPLVGPVSAGGRIIAMTGFSGHGFKFSPTMGEVAADLVTTGKTNFPINHMTPSRVSVAR